MIVVVPLFMQMAATCSPTVAPQTLAAIARTESGFNPYAILDNDSRRSFRPNTLVEAQSIAAQLVGAGHSVDVGLMQVNSRNFARLGLTAAQALDPCSSLAAGARLLVEAYQGGTTDAEQQHALRVALSRYNTGDPAMGFTNGYVRKVEASTGYIVPALTMESGQAPTLSRDTPAATAPPQDQRSWDVWAQTADAASAIVASWDASPDSRNAAAAPSTAAPLDPPRPPEARVVMLQTVQSSEKKR